MSITSAYLMPHPPIILPEVGRGEEAVLHSTTHALEQCARSIAQLAPETIVIVSPHAATYQDYFHISQASYADGSMAQFGAGNVRFTLDCDTEYAQLLAGRAHREEFPAGTLGQDAPLDHGVMVPLYFVNQVYTDYKLVRLSFSGLSPISHYHYGEVIAGAAKKLGRNTVFIASGDLSHKLKSDGPYGYAPEGPTFDKRVTNALTAGDFDSFLGYDPAFCESAAECGLRSLQILAGVVGEAQADTQLLSYEGPFGVGYAVCEVSLHE